MGSYRWLFLGQHNVMFGLAISIWIHGGHAYLIIFLSAVFHRRLLHAERDAGESRFALRVGVNTQIKFMRAGKSVSQVHINADCVDRLAACVSDCKFRSARAGTAIDSGGFFRLCLGLSLTLILNRRILNWRILSLRILGWCWGLRGKQRDTEGKNGKRAGAANGVSHRLL